MKAQAVQAQVVPPRQPCCCHRVRCPQPLCWSPLRRWGRGGCGRWLRRRELQPHAWVGMTSPPGTCDAAGWRGGCWAVSGEIGADIYGISFECGRCVVFPPPLFFFNEILIIANILWCRGFKKGGRTYPKPLRPAYIAVFFFCYCSVEDTNIILSCCFHPLCSPAFFHQL